MCKKLPTDKTMKNGIFVGSFWLFKDFLVFFVQLRVDFLT